VSPVPTWGWLSAVAVLALLCGIQTVRVASLNTEIAEIVVLHEKAVAKQQADRAEAERLAREREQELTAQAGKLLQDKQDENDRIADRLGVALVRLRDRAERPAAVAGAVPGASAACQGADGRLLSVRDAEFLERLAARADRHRAALAECYGRFDSLSK
jgi:hypothetical protein